MCFDCGASSNHRSNTVGDRSKVSPGAPSAPAASTSSRGSCPELRARLTLIVDFNRLILPQESNSPGRAAKKRSIAPAVPSPRRLPGAPRPVRRSWAWKSRRAASGLRGLGRASRPHRLWHIGASFAARLHPQLGSSDALCSLNEPAIHANVTMLIRVEVEHFDTDSPQSAAIQFPRKKGPDEALSPGFRPTNVVCRKAEHLSADSPQSALLQLGPDEALRANPRTRVGV